MSTRFKASMKLLTSARAGTVSRDACEVVDRGPNWLFVRVRSEALSGKQGLAERLFAIASQHLIYRLVLELDGLTTLDTRAIRELVRLQYDLQEHDGALRLCGMRPKCAEALRQSAEHGTLHNQPDRHSAVGDSWCGGPADYLKCDEPGLEYDESGIKCDERERPRPEKEPDHAAREEKPRPPLPNKPR